MEFYLAHPPTPLFNQQIGQMMHLVSIQLEITFAAHAVNHDVFARKIGNAIANHSFGKFLLEANFGVIIHLENALFGFLIAFIPPCSSPSIWIPVSAVNFVLSMLPVFVLRFTSHTLKKLYIRSKKNGLH